MSFFVPDDTDAHVPVLQLHNWQEILAVASHEVPLGGEAAQMFSLRTGIQDLGIFAGNATTSELALIGSYLIHVSCFRTM